MLSTSDELEAIERGVAPSGSSRLHNKASNRLVSPPNAYGQNPRPDQNSKGNDHRAMMMALASQRSDSKKGEDLLVGWPGSDQYEDDDEDRSRPPSTRKAGIDQSKTNMGGSSSSVTSVPPSYKTGSNVGGSAAGSGQSRPGLKQSRGNRSSFVMQPESMAALGAFDDYDDSDDDDDIPPLPQSNNSFGLNNSSGSSPSVPKSFRGERDSDAPAFRGSGSGEPAAHRPLVGGFAAAAYEAAREFHYKNDERQAPRMDRFSRPPPSI